MIELRPLRVPDDFPALADMLSAVAPGRFSLQSLIDDETRPTGVRYRVVAVNGSELCGYGLVRRRDSDPAGQFFVKVYTAVGARRQGIGSVLLEGVEAAARRFGATRLETGVRDNEPDAVSFAERHGYVRRRHIFESVQDLTRFDPAAFAADLARVAAQGIRLFTLADEPGEQSERKLHELYSRTEQDVPGLELTPRPFEFWRQLVIERKGFRPEAVVIAADGDRYVGCSVMIDMGVEDSLHVWMTGVDRAYRGRGIALALKVVAAQSARALGVKALCTNNDAENGPMLAVNRKLGFEPAPGQYLMEKQG
ncbi:MAG TPA: GNAT family N-acetyltransferase [Symbiobacteriaceae bacterium]|jgi:GNAT superfamily N-acetyltransferase|nr:GNAT family N-acetyltransferase [Symbiobacteriaceae bacterium]